MIDAKELRLGNWFYDKVTKRYCYIANIDHGGFVRVFFPNSDMDKDSLSTVSIRELQPIELIEVILIRCGVYVSTGTYGPIYSFDNIPPMEIYYDTNERVWVVTYSDALLCKPKYLHQLQNLYFALTGEELEFKS